MCTEFLQPLNLYKDKNKTVKASVVEMLLFRLQLYFKLFIFVSFCIIYLDENQLSKKQQTKPQSLFLYSFCALIIPLERFLQLIWVLLELLCPCWTQCSM